MADTETVEVEIVEEPVDLVANAFKYFSRTNYTNKNILFEEKCLKKHLESQWDSIPSDRRDDLLDLMFVDEEVRMKYKENDSTADDNFDVVESFPRLLLNMGQKINVDFENELWTWKDEHSGPFSWMSRSQQDLTLADLDAENILKPQPKQPRVDLDDETSVKKAGRQFTYPCNSWCHDLVEDFKRHQGDIVLTPSPSLDFNNVNKGRGSIEELNQGFEGSTSDLSTKPKPEEPHVEIEADQTSSQESSNKKGDRKDRGRKSPSPQKIIFRSGSLKKSPIKKSNKGREEKLIIQGIDDSCSTDEAYCNPVMESEWSSFVGDTPAPAMAVPETQTIDRGGDQVKVEMSGASPYRGDQMRLIPETEDSPVIPSQHRKTPELSDWSVESTPDHKTHLLKGMQTNNTSTQGHQQLKFEKSDTDESKYGPDDHPEDVITVFTESSEVKLSSQDPEKRDSNIPCTGFDFLDNW